MKTIGYLGLGIMGYGMTSNLIDKSGITVYGFDPIPALRERFEKRGGKATADAAELYRACDIIFMCLPTNAIVKNTITDIMNTARPGTIIVDMGSTSPYVIKELHATAQKKGFHLLDSPVSGGETGANGGSLVIMSGGEKEVFARTRREARQIVDHKHVLVNGKCVNIPSYLIKAGDVIEIKESAKSMQRYKDILDVTAGRLVPEWIDADVENFKGTIKNLPTREMIDVPVDEMLIVELYSK